MKKPLIQILILLNIFIHYKFCAARSTDDARQRHTPQIPVRPLDIFALSDQKTYITVPNDDQLHYTTENNKESANVLTPDHPPGTPSSSTFQDNSSSVHEEFSHVQHLSPDNTPTISFEFNTPLLSNQSHFLFPFTSSELSQIKNPQFIGSLNPSWSNYPPSSSFPSYPLNYYPQPIYIPVYQQDPNCNITTSLPEFGSLPTTTSIPDFSEEVIISAPQSISSIPPSSIQPAKPSLPSSTNEQKQPASFSENCEPYETVSPMTTSSSESFKLPPFQILQNEIHFPAHFVPSSPTVPEQPQLVPLPPNPLYISQTLSTLSPESNLQEPEKLLIPEPPQPLPIPEAPSVHPTSPPELFPTNCEPISSSMTHSPLCQSSNFVTSMPTLPESENNTFTQISQSSLPFPVFPLPPTSPSKIVFDCIPHLEYAEDETNAPAVSSYWKNDNEKYEYIPTPVSFSPVPVFYKYSNLLTDFSQFQNTPSVQKIIPVLPLGLQFSSDLDINDQSLQDFQNIPSSSVPITTIYQNFSLESIVNQESQKLKSIPSPPSPLPIPIISSNISSSQINEDDRKIQKWKNIIPSPPSPLPIPAVIKKSSISQVSTSSVSNISSGQIKKGNQESEKFKYILPPSAPLPIPIVPVIQKSSVPSVSKMSSNQLIIDDNTSSFSNIFLPPMTQKVSFPELSSFSVPKVSSKPLADINNFQNEWKNIPSSQMPMIPIIHESSILQDIVPEKRITSGIVSGHYQSQEYIPSTSTHSIFHKISPSEVLFPQLDSQWSSNAVLQNHSPQELIKPPIPQLNVPNLQKVIVRKKLVTTTIPTPKPSSTISNNKC